MSAEFNWQAFFQEKRTQYIEQWVTYARLHTHDYAKLDGEVANLLSSAQQASEGSDHHHVMALAQLLCTGDEAFLDLRASVRLLSWAVDAARALQNEREEGRLLGSLGLCWWALGKQKMPLIAWNKHSRLHVLLVTDREREGTWAALDWPGPR